MDIGFPLLKCDRSIRGSGCAEMPLGPANSQREGGEIGNLRISSLWEDET
jgi:hypothetical protein